MKKDKITYNHGKIVHICIVFETSKNNNINSLPTLENCLFGAASSLKIMIMIRMNILDMQLHLIDIDVFHILVVELVEV